MTPTWTNPPPPEKSAVLRAEVERLRRVEEAARAVVTSHDDADDYMDKAVVSRHCLNELRAALTPAKPASGKEQG